MLSRSQKLIIGHNMLLDLAFTIQQFIQPLPATLDEFKAILSSTFPRLVDTKLMGSMLPFRVNLTNIRKKASNMNGLSEIFFSRYFCGLDFEARDSIFL